MCTKNSHLGWRGLIPGSVQAQGGIQGNICDTGDQTSQLYTRQVN